MLFWYRHLARPWDCGAVAFTQALPEQREYFQSQCHQSIAM